MTEIPRSHIREALRRTTLRDPRWLLLALPGLLLALPSCTSERAEAQGRGPLTVAERFVDAVNAEDAAALEATLTVAARRGLRSGSGFDIAGEPLEDVSFGPHTITGETATVPIVATRAGRTDEVVLGMKKEEGEWRIHAFTVETGGASMTLDLEEVGSIAQQFAESIGASMQQAFEEARLEHEARERARRTERFEGLRSLTPENFEASWRITQDFRGEPAHRAIVALASELGLRADLRGVLGTLDRPVTRDVRGESRAHAIEMIAADLGCHPVFPSPHDLDLVGTAVAAFGTAMTDALLSEGGPLSVSGDLGELGAGTADSLDEPDPGALRIEAGPPAPGIQHVGPVRIAAEQVDHEPRYGTGSVSVVVRSYGLDPAVAALCTSLGEAISFSSVVDDRGRELRVSPDVRYYGGGGSFRGALEDVTSVDLKNLLRDVPRIAEITGRYRLSVPTEVLEATVDDLTVGAEGRIGPFGYMVKQTGSSTTIAFTGPKDALPDLLVFARPLDAAGEDIAFHHESKSVWGRDEAQYSIQSESEPVTLELRLVTRRETVEFPFSLEGIPLPHAGEAPAALAALEFPGHSRPVAVEFVELRKSGTDFPEVVLTVTNHANKDIGSLVVRFEYLDAAGKQLEDFPHTLSGPMSFEGEQPLAAAGATVEHVGTAFFVPEATRSVRLVLETVEFLDSTRWQPAER